jgi:fatty acid desaturase
MDLHGIEDMGIHDPLTRAVLFRHLVTPLIGRHLPYYLSFDVSAKDGRAFQVFKFVLIALALTALAFFPLATALFIAVPYFFLSPTLNYWADCIDHAGLVAEEDDLDASRNVRVPTPVQALFFPRNDNYHLVHHLFPSIPARHLDQAHKTLLDDQLYSQRSNATGGREQAAVKELATVK